MLHDTAKKKKKNRCGQQGGALLCVICGISRALTFLASTWHPTFQLPQSLTPTPSQTGLRRGGVFSSAGEFTVVLSGVGALGQSAGETPAFVFWGWSLLPYSSARV